MNLYSERINRLREMMQENSWDAVVIFGTDPHSSEYPSARWKQVEWLTGFTGEAGNVVVTMTEAGLWTDSRYFIQAVEQLDGTGVRLHKARLPESVDIPEWLSLKNLKRIAVDGLCVDIGTVKCMKAAQVARENFDAEIIDVPDLLSSLWEDRPQVPATPIVTQDIESFGGQPRSDKIAWLRWWMSERNIDSVLLSSLDEIAWLLNVRGNDIEYNPLVISYLLVTQDYVKWFVRKESHLEEMDGETIDSFTELENDNVAIKEYSSLCFALDTLVSENPQTNIFVDSSTLNSHIYNYISDLLEESSMLVGRSPVILQKAIKSESEIEHLRQTFIDDGVAMETFLYWLEQEVNSGVEVSEWDASRKLTEIRSQVPGYRGNSFENISAYGKSAALPHYSTPMEDSPIIQPYGLYLVDSGGQYLTGTTDITRTVPMGECTELEKEDYTLVLKGMIDLSMAVFPRGTAGCQLDALARMPLWQAGRNFGHGTGHGIGYWLCVHEGPQSIRQDLNPQALLPGMVTSNEPGLYREGQHGIRHENIILCQPSEKNDFGDWLKFETLTCCHIDTAAVLPELMDPRSIKWLNDYNNNVYETLSELLPTHIAEWLKAKCEPIQ